jgi:hypothetical protein
MLHDHHLVCSDTSITQCSSSDSAPPLAPFALILVHRLVGARAHNFFFFFFLGGIISLFVVLSHVDAINTTIVTFDSLFLLDTHGYELFECTLVIHGVVVHLESFKFLRE